MLLPRKQGRMPPCWHLWSGRRRQQRRQQPQRQQVGPASAQDRAGSVQLEQQQPQPQQVLIPCNPSPSQKRAHTCLRTCCACACEGLTTACCRDVSCHVVLCRAGPIAAARQAAEAAKSSNMALQEARRVAAREQQARDEQLMQETIRWVDVA